MQGDEKVLVAGDFTTLGGQTANYIGRLNPDGTLDTAFNPVGDSWTFAVATQPDGKILVGGWFDSLGGQVRNYLGRLNADGSLEPDFNPAPRGEEISRCLRLGAAARREDHCGRWHDKSWLGGLHEYRPSQPKWIARCDLHRVGRRVGVLSGFAVGRRMVIGGTLPMSAGRRGVTLPG